MPSISAQLKVFAEFDWSNLAKSKLKVQVLHTKKGWRPLFEITAKDMIKLFNKSKRRMK